MPVYKVFIPVCKMINIVVERKHVSNMATGCIWVYDFVFHDEWQPQTLLAALLALGPQPSSGRSDCKCSRLCRPYPKSQCLSSVKPKCQGIYMNKWMLVCSHEYLWCQHWIPSNFYMSQNTIVISIVSPRSLKLVKIVCSSHGPYKTRQWAGFGPQAESVAQLWPWELGTDAVVS